MSKIRTGLMSFGLSGQVFHAPLIEKNENFELSVILERSKRKSEQEYPKVKIVTSLADFFQEELDLIIVNGPSALHYDWAKKAIQHCKAVVVEKPFVATTSQGKELVCLAKKRKVALSVYHNKRFEGNIRTVKKLLDSGKYGRVKRLVLRAMRYRPALGLKQWKEKPQPAAGLLYDIGSHLIDQSLWLFGRPESLRAQLKKQRVGSQVDDYFNVIFQYCGFEVELEAGFLQKENLPVIELYTHSGVYKKYDPDPQEAQLAQRPINWEILGHTSQHKDGKWSFATGNTASVPTALGDYGEFYKSLSGFIKGEGDNPVKPEEALEVIEWIEKIKQIAGVSI